MHAMAAYELNTFFVSLLVESAAPGPVTNLQMTTPSATTLPIIWTASGTIDSFQVTYSYSINRCSEQGTSVTDTITDGSVRAHTLSGLNEDSRYTIIVRAINTAGSTMATVTADTLTAGEMR